MHSNLWIKLSSNKSISKSKNTGCLLIRFVNLFVEAITSSYFGESTQEYQWLAKRASTHLNPILSILPPDHPGSAFIDEIPNPLESGDSVAMGRATAGHMSLIIDRIRNKIFHEVINIK